MRISDWSSDVCSSDLLVAGLADLSREGLELVGEHAGELRTDIQTLADAAATIDANLSSVTQLLEAGSLLTTGLGSAYNPELRAIDLRNNFTPLVTEALDLVLGQLGLPPVCLEILQECPVAGASAATPTAADLTGTSPVRALLDLLGARTASSEGSR